MKKRVLSLLLTVAMLAGLIPVVASVPALAAAPETEEIPAYWEWYVEDGLTMLLDAYDSSPANKTISIASDGAGTWQSRVKNKDGVYATATLDQKTGTSFWRRMTTGGNANFGIGYDMTIAQFKANRDTDVSKRGSSVGLDLGLSNLPDGDYTVEMILNPKGVVEESGTLGYMDTLSFIWYPYSFGTLKGWGFPCIRYSGDAVNSDETYNIRWVDQPGNYDYSGGKWYTETGLAVYQNPTKNTLYTPHVINYTVSMDETESAGAYSGRAVIRQDGTAKLDHTFPSGKYYRKSELTGAGFFCMMYGWPGTVYSVRVYDRVLTDTERAYNRGVDILAFYRVAMPASAKDLLSVPAFRAGVTGAVSGFDFVDGEGYAEEKEAVEAAVGQYLASCDFSGMEYASLYVQDGLTMLLSAYQPDSTLDVTNGKWYSMVGNGVATLYSAGGTAGTWAIGSLAGSPSGIGYAASGVTTGRTTGIRFDWDALPKDDFTFEIVVTPDRLRGDSLSGSYCMYTFSFGPLKGYGWPKFSGGAPGYTNLGLSWVYSATDHEHFVNNIMWAMQDAEFANANGTTFLMDLTHDRSFAGGTYSGKYALSYNAVGKYSATYNGANSNNNDKSNTDYPTAYVDPETMTTGAYKAFSAMEGYPGTVYAVRVYDRVLSAAEQKHNLGVDVLAYYRIDLSSVPECYRFSVADAVAAFPFAGADDYAATKAEVQATVNGFLASYDLSDGAYASLYVQDGLTMLLSAYAINPTVDVAGGKWSSLVGTGFATLYSAGGTAGTWATKTLNDAPSGIGYAASSVVNGRTTGLRFHWDALPDDDFTFEIVVTPDRLRGDSLSGSFCMYTFSFGPMKGYGWPMYNGKANGYTNLGLTWTYGPTNHESATFLKPWCISDDTFFDMTGTTLRFAVTCDRTLTAEGYTESYGLWRNTEASAKYTANTGTAGYLDPETLTDTYKTFSAMEGYPCTVYAVRVYDRALSAAEQKHNFGVDVLAYYRIELPDGISAACTERIVMTAADNTLSATGYAATKAALQAAVADVIAEQTELEEKQAEAAAYIAFENSLYVQNGLVALFSAYRDTGTVDLTLGTWQDQIGGGTATFVGGARSDAKLTGWFLEDGGGVGYRSASASCGNAIEIDPALLPSGSFTVDMAVTPYGLTQQDGTPVYDTDSSQYGTSYAYAFRFGPFKGYGYPSLRSETNQYVVNNGYALRYTSHEIMWYYAATGTNYTWHLADFGLYYASRNQIQDASHPIRYTVTHDRTGSAGNYTSKYAVYANGALCGYGDASSSSATSVGTTWSVSGGSYVAKEASDNKFTLFGNFPATVYSVRVYDHALTAAEQQQNHFADLVLYHGLDIADTWKRLPESARIGVYEAFSAFDFQTDVSTLMGVLNLYLRPAGLYVEDGLLYLVTSFRNYRSGTDLLSGAWHTNVGEEDATLFGNGWWSTAEGTGFSLHFDRLGQNTGLSLPADLLDRENYTVQILADVRGVREDNGGKVGDPIYLDRTADLSYDFGGLRAKVNVTPKTNALDYPIVWYVGDNHAAATRVFDVDTPAFTAEKDGIRLFGISKATGTNETYTFDNGAMIEVPKGTVGGGDFTLFRANPATVYSIRVYGRALTAAEQLQNHFADIAFYYGLDPVSILALTDGQRETLYDTFADIGFDYTEEEIAAIYAYALGDTAALLSAAIRYDGLSVRMTGDYPGIRSLYTVNKRLVAVLEKDGYLVAYGAVMGVGEFGDKTINTTRSLSVTGNFASGYTTANANAAVVTVYGSAGATFSPTGMFTRQSETEATFAFTTVLDEETDNATYYALGMVYTGYIAAEKDGAPVVAYAYAEGATFGKEGAKYGPSASIADLACYFVNDYTGSNADMVRYWSSERLNHILSACGISVTRTVVDEAALMAARQADLEDAMAVNIATELKTCGDTLASGNETPYVWLQWAPKYDYSADDRVKGAFLYYPMTFDPSLYSEEQLQAIDRAAKAIAAGTYRESDFEAGELAAINAVKHQDGTVDRVVRVFCYVGIPEGAASAAADTYPGIVCTHGGAGHAYASYVQEALSYGFAAIAMDTEGAVPLSTNPKGGNNGASSNSGCDFDPLGHKGKDNWANADGAFTDQWMYYAVSDVIFCNTALRSFAYVDADRVGMTGISWGGVITSCTIGFDSRLAFAVPVYCGYFLEEDAAGLSINAFAAELWQPEARLAAVTVPTLVLTSQNDIWASLNTSQRFYETLGDYGYITLKTGYGHHQGGGASAGEIYYFAKWIMGDLQSDPLTVGSETEYGITFETESGVLPTREDGHSYTLQLTVPAYLSGTPVVKLNYVTSALTYSNGQNVDQLWQSVSLTPYQNGGDWFVDVEVPEGVYLYYLTFQGYNAALKSLQDANPNSGSNFSKGYIWTSTDVIVLGSGKILAE